MHRTAAIPTEPRAGEAALIAGTLAGDRTAARALYDAHAPRVYRLAYRLTSEAELAREVTQDVFVRAFGRLARFRGDAAFSTWLHRITVRMVAERLRQVVRRREREVPLESWQPEDVMPSPVDPIMRERLHRAIDELPEMYRTVVIMHDIEGYTHAEIGEAVGVAEGTSKSRLSLARARLREALEDLREESS